MNQIADIQAPTVLIDLFGNRSTAVLSQSKERKPKLTRLEAIKAKAREKQPERESQPIYTPVLNIRPSYSTLYSERLDGNARPRTQKFLENMKNLKLNETGGIISKKAKKNIAAAIDWLIQAASVKTVHRTSNNSMFQFKINFITLTLSAKQRHSDIEIKARLLDPFLQLLRDSYGLKNYLWRAEAQVNGNIHFHLITDVFIHYMKLRDAWNEIQERLGYISDFEAKSGHRNPNSTDIHSIKNIKNIAGYLSKYCCKNLFYVNVPNSDYSLKKEFHRAGLDCKNTFKKEATDKRWCIHDITEDQKTFIEKAGLTIVQPRAINGRLWYLSASLQKMNSLKIYLEESNDVKAEFDNMYDCVHSGMIKSFDFCTVVLWKISDFIEHKAKKIHSLIEGFYERLKAPQSSLIYTV